MQTHRLLRTLKVAAFTLALLLPFTVGAADPAAPCGICYARGAQGERIMVPLESTEVVLDVKPGLIEAEIIQTFTNHTNTSLEATYLYPLPHEATITDVELRYQDRVIKSLVKEKAQARQAYDAAREAGKKTALVEQRDPSLFSTAVANFLPGETVKVVFRFTQPLAISARSVEVRFPMTTGVKYFLSEPQPVPDKPTAPTPLKVDASTVSSHHVYAYDVTIHGIPATTIESPSHKIQVQSTSMDRFSVALAEEITIPDRDFVLRIETKPVAKTTPTAVTQRTTTGNYGLVTLFPPLTSSFSTHARTGFDFLFLIDHSGSMSGPRIASARVGLQATLQNLSPQDRFQIVIFDSSYSFYSREWNDANQEEISKAVSYVGQIQANSGTEMQKALKASLEFIADRPTNRQAIIIFLTDGDVGNEGALLKFLENKIGCTRLFAFGIGEAPNNYLIKKMAELGRGQARFISDDKSIARELDSLFATLEAPVLTDVKLSFFDSQGAPADVTLFPKTVSDLFAGHPIQSIFATPGTLPAVVQLDALEDGKPIQIRQSLTSTEARGTAIEKLFGRFAYDEQNSQLRRTSTPEQQKAIQAEMLSTALRYQLVTEFTSRVAIEEKISRAPGAPLQSTSVAQYGARDQQGVGTDVDDLIVLSPFEVETDIDRSYNACNSISGSRVRTNLRDIGSCISVVTKDFIDDFGILRPEDLAPFIVLPQFAPGIADSAAATSLLNGQPVATVVDTETIDQLGFASIGAGPNSINQRIPSPRSFSSLTTHFGERGFASATLQSNFRLTGDSSTPMLVTLTGSQFDHRQWSASINNRRNFGSKKLLSSLQRRELEGYGQMQMASLTFNGEIGDNKWIDINITGHSLRRDNPRQFELGSSTQLYDGLGIYNLDLLTAEARRLQDGIATLSVGGEFKGTKATQTWSASAAWHRQIMDSFNPTDTTTLARRCDGLAAKVTYEIGSKNDGFFARTEFGAKDFALGNETSRHKSTYRVAETVSCRLIKSVSAVVAASHETQLPFVSTGEIETIGSEQRIVTAKIEDRQNIQGGLDISTLNKRITGRLSFFHEVIEGQAFRDWAWEKDHATAVLLANGNVRLPVSYGTWKRYEQNGCLGNLDFTPTPEITGILSWYEGLKNDGPYLGGNRRASAAVRYNFRSGFLRNLGVGAAISTRNTLTFNDGYILQGGTRYDLFVKYKIRLFGSHWTHVQLNLLDLTHVSWRPTRFASDRGRQVLFSLRQEF